VTVHGDTKALSLLHRIIHGEDPFFAKSTSLLPKALDCLQRSANINSLPSCIQTEFYKAIKFFLDRVKKNESILASAVLARLSPILLSGNRTRDSADSALLTLVGSSDNDQPPPRMDSTFVPVMQSPRDTDAAMVAQLRPRPTFDPSRHAPPVDRRASGSNYDRRTDGRLRHDRPDGRMRQDRADGRVRQDRPDDRLHPARSSTFHSRRPDDRNDIDRLRQENADLTLISTFEDPEAVLESCRISESGPAHAGPDPTSPTSSSDISDVARPLHGRNHIFGP
jgi:hypothetical protein